MKPLAVIALSLVVSGLTAVGVAIGMDSNNDDALDTGSRDQSLDAAQGRLTEIEDKIDVFDRKMDRFLAELKSTDQIMVSPTQFLELQNDVARLRDEIGDMSARGGASVRIRKPNGEEVVASADALEEIVSKRLKKDIKASEKRARRNRYKEWQPMAKMGMMQGIRRNAKKLKLNQEQTKRLEKSATQALDTIMPRFGVLMDPDAGQAERDTALADIRNAGGDVTNDAESYMTAEQFAEFETIREQEEAQMEQWIEAMAQMGGTGEEEEEPTSQPSGN